MTTILANHQQAGNQDDSVPVPGRRDTPKHGVARLINHKGERITDHNRQKFWRNPADRVEDGAGVHHNQKEHGDDRVDVADEHAEAGQQPRDSQAEENQRQENERQIQGRQRNGAMGQS